MKITLKALPKFYKTSPNVVKAFDKMRFEILDNLDEDSDEDSEFYWYAREFPRYYRYHIDNVEFRIKKIHSLYEFHLKDFLKEKSKIEKSEMYERGIYNTYTYQIYWEFEALLNALSASLDILSRISGLEFEHQTPLSLNQLSKKKDLNGVVDIFRKAKQDWIDEMKNLRDCFVHYCPIDSMPTIIFYKTKTMWKIWCKLPTNPNIRVVDGFKYSRNLDLLKYSYKLYSNFKKLDEEVANYLLELYDKKEFPKRVNNLFLIGQRQK
jgi:hypothetical protein